jgi:hypothetical protein
VADLVIRPTAPAQCSLSASPWLLLGHDYSLYFFKQKFHPVWEPRYLVVAEISTLPRVLIALAVVHGMSWRTLLDEAYTAVRRPKHNTLPDDV